MSFHIFHSCTILVYSIGVLHLAHFQRCNLGEFDWHTQFQTGSRGFHFLCCSILQRNSPNFGMEILQNIVGVYIFPNFVLVQYIVVQKLVKTNPRRLNTFCLFLLFACNSSNLSKEEAGHSY